MIPDLPRWFLRGMFFGAGMISAFLLERLVEIWSDIVQRKIK